MFVCTTVLYEYMNSLRNDVCNLFVNTHLRIQIYHVYHCIIYIANEGRHVRIMNNRIKCSLCSTQLTHVYRQCLYLPIDKEHLHSKCTIPSISPIANFNFLSNNIPTPPA